MKISVVSPVYQAESTVDELVKRIIEEVKPLCDDFELILVDDGSQDLSWEKIEKNCVSNSSVVGVKLSRNFGQHYAITAGIEQACGDAVIVMDCDLQDDPKYFADLLKKHSEGYDIVYTYRKQRKHSFFKNLTAAFFNRVFNWLVGEESYHSSKNVGSFSLLSRKAADAYLTIKDYHRHYLMILRWLGFDRAYVNVEHQNRFAGKSSYTFTKLLMHAIDGITSQSDKILRLTVVFGFFMSFLSFLSALFIVISAFITPFKAGWASTSVLILFVGGLVITSIGILGIYIGKIFEQSKSRPLYLIDKVINK